MKMRLPGECERSIRSRKNLFRQPRVLFRKCMNFMRIEIQQGQAFGAHVHFQT